MGIQPAHSDASELRGSELRRRGLKPLSELDPLDKPLSTMAAIQEGTKLWVFPGGCDPGQIDAAFFIEVLPTVNLTLNLEPRPP